MSEQKSSLISTDAKAILSSWKTLSKLIIKHTTLVKDAVRGDPEKEQKPFILLNEQQLSDALEGPWQSFFTQKMQTYALIARVQMELTLESEESFKQNRTPLEGEEPLPKEALGTLTPADLEGMRKELDTLTKEHNDQWETQINEWFSQLIEQLAKHHIQLSILELAEIQNREPMSELFDRFTELNIKLPKLKKRAMNFANYLRLKADLAIHSNLARQHLSHEQHEIEKVLKHLHHFFTQINKEEKKLLAEQQATTDKTVNKILFAKTKK